MPDDPVSNKHNTMLTAVRAKRILTMADQRPCTRQEAVNMACSPSFPSSASPYSVQTNASDNSSGNVTAASSSAAEDCCIIEDGVVVAENGIIRDVLPYAQFHAAYSVTPTDLGNATILPGLINCHSHLELAHLGGKATFGMGFENWIGSLLPLMGIPVSESALDAAIHEMLVTGTVHVADVNGRAPKPAYDAATRVGLGIDLQMEVFGYAFPDNFTTDDIWAHFLSGSAGALPDAVRKRNLLLAGHSLYSTHPAALVFAKQWCRSHERHFSIHLAEHKGEEELLVRGTGRFRDMLGVRVLPPDFLAPGMRPVAYAAELGLLDDRTLAVHCVHCNESDIDLLHTSGTHVCLCPRSNACIGVGRAPVYPFMEAGVPLCLGTDSLASNHDLNLWNEARTLRDEYGVSSTTLLRMLTTNGARALGLTETLGTLEQGRHFRYAVLPDDFVDCLN